MRPRKKVAWAAASGALVVAGSLGLAACGGSSSSGSKTNSSNASSAIGFGQPFSNNPQKGGTYRVGTTDFGFNGGFDPSGEYLAWAQTLYQNLLLRGLTGFKHVLGNEGNQVVADAAESIPTPTDGGKTWTFKIKPGIKFGPPVNREVTSKDYYTAFERIGTKSVVAQYGFYYNDIVGMKAFEDGKAKTISGITMPDAHTIVFKTTKAIGDFPQRLSMGAATPFPAEVANCFKKVGEYGRYIISSGPYMIKGSDKLNIKSCATMKPISGFNPSKELDFVRNPNYDPATDSADMRQSFPDAFTFTVDSNEKDIFDKVQAGQFDDSVDAVPPDVARTYATDSTKKNLLQSHADDSTNYIYMNMSEAPFDDVHVRKAVNWIINRTALRKAWGGPLYGTLGSHIVPPAVYGDGAGDINSYDPYSTPNQAGDATKAAAEMKLSAYDTNKDGKCDVAACNNVIFLNRSIDPFVKMTPLIRDALAKLGINLKVRELPTGPAYETSGVVANRIQIGSNARWGKDYADPSTFFDPLFTGKNIIPTGNSNYALTGLTAAQAKTLKIPYPKGGVPNFDADIAKCDATTGTDRTACFVALDKKVSETAAPWAVYEFGANTDLLSTAVTAWNLDQSNGETAYAHVAVDPSKQK
ncbi:MAG: ABC transporter substrate-binding protein [Thermoleophilia bacterium]